MVLQCKNDGVRQGAMDKLRTQVQAQHLRLMVLPKLSAPKQLLQLPATLAFKALRRAVEKQQPGAQPKAKGRGKGKKVGAPQGLSLIHISEPTRLDVI
eukprot:8688029-Prorocentrum_lima.AAC.1